MMLDKQGRINIGKKTCEELKIFAGSEVVFVREGEMRYRIAPIEDVVLSDDIVVDSERSIDTKYRVSVPAQIRGNFTPHADITYSKKMGYVYITFFKLA